MNLSMSDYVLIGIGIGIILMLLGNITVGAVISLSLMLLSLFGPFSPVPLETTVHVEGGL